MKKLIIILLVAFTINVDAQDTSSSLNVIDTVLIFKTNPVEDIKFKYALERDSVKIGLLKQLMGDELARGEIKFQAATDEYIEACKLALSEYKRKLTIIDTLQIEVLEYGQMYLLGEKKELLSAKYDAAKDMEERYAAKIIQAENDKNIDVKAVKKNKDIAMRQHQEILQIYRLVDKQIKDKQK